MSKLLANMMILVSIFSFNISKIIVMDEKDLRKLLEDNKFGLNTKNSLKRNLSKNEHLQEALDDKDMIGIEFDMTTKEKTKVWFGRCSGEYGDVWAKVTETISTYIVASEEEEYECDPDSVENVKNFERKQLWVGDKHPCPEFSIVQKDEDENEARYVPVVVESYFGKIPGQFKLSEDNIIDDSYADFPYGDYKNNSKIAYFICPKN